MRERGDRLVAVGLERVDAQIERRPGGKRRPLLGALLAEGGGEMGIEPFRVIAKNVGRSAVERAAFQTLALMLAQGAGRMARAVAQRRDGRDVEPALALEHAEADRPRARLAHDPGRGGPAA